MTQYIHRVGASRRRNLWDASFSMPLRIYATLPVTMGFQLSRTTLVFLIGPVVHKCAIFRYFEALIFV